MKFSKISLLVFIVALASFSGIFLQILITLPKVDTLDYYMPSESTMLFSSDKKPLARFHKEENRRVVSFSEMSPIMLKAIVAIEDERFYSHHGLDFQGITRAMFKNMLYGRIVEGGSTITQQLAKNLFLNRKKNIIRKIAEAILAFQLERRFTKEEILEYYLNQIYFGHNAYGLESASDLYFNKHAKDLDLAQAALIAGIIEGPEIYSPYKDFKLAKGRQKLVLAKMLELNMINASQANQAYQEPLSIYPENLKKFGTMAPYFVEYIQQELISRFGEEIVNQGGLQVYTTLDPAMQIAAEDTIHKFINIEGPKYHFTQSALIAIDPRTGYIKAMVGGADFVKSQFNRAIQAKRQPGSSFKPFIYATAIEQGISPGTVLEDKPITLDVYKNKWNPDGKWAPHNFDNKYRGNVTMQYALEKSLNIPAVKLMQRVGINSAIQMARRLGIKSHLEPSLSLSLGASEVSLYEITSAFGVFANAGMRVEPSSIISIIDRNGNVIYENKNTAHRVLDENIAAIMDEMMEGVLLRGTGVMGRISRPAAAKTGTSQDFKDAWMIGFTPQLVAGVWVGNDDNAPMKGVAEVAVCPRIWKEFVSAALVNEPIVDFVQPKGLFPVKICLSSGFLPNSSCPKDKIVTAKYFEKDIPISECYVHPLDKTTVEEEAIPPDQKEEGENGNTD